MHRFTDNYQYVPHLGGFFNFITWIVGTVILRFMLEIGRDYSDKLFLKVRVEVFPVRKFWSVLYACKFSGASPVKLETEIVLLRIAGL